MMGPSCIYMRKGDRYFRSIFLSACHLLQLTYTIKEAQDRKLGQDLDHDRRILFPSGDSGSSYERHSLCSFFKINIGVFPGSVARLIRLM